MPRPATSVIANLRLHEMLIISLSICTVKQGNVQACQGQLIAVVVMPLLVVAAFGYKDAAAQRASKTNGQ
ncbi:hypothetical protein LMG28138_03021 [Pararobbsia alpina]|uniref:Uncharacterized protein n=1 Tax=Pararobbsia alpina TaxID=621374 RepID=A0A6S7CII2_9BURK|nr:hypothetical protein LMG28138_03021 [Pararobbsia alpina]